MTNIDKPIEIRISEFIDNDISLWKSINRYRFWVAVNHKGFILGSIFFMIIFTTWTHVLLYKKSWIFRIIYDIIEPNHCLKNETHSISAMLQIYKDVDQFKLSRKA